MRNPTSVSEMLRILTTLMQDGQEMHQKSNELIPTGFILKENKEIILGEFDFSSDDQKEKSLKAFQLAILMTKAASAFVIADVWSVESKTPLEENEKIIDMSTDDLPKDLSQHPDAIESIVAVGYNGHDMIIMRLPYSRDTQNHPIYADEVSSIVSSELGRETIAYASFFPTNWESDMSNSPRYLM